MSFEEAMNERYTQPVKESLSLFHRREALDPDKMSFFFKRDGHAICSFVLKGVLYEEIERVDVTFNELSVPYLPNRDFGPDLVFYLMEGKRPLPIYLLTFVAVQVKIVRSEERR